MTNVELHDSFKPERYKLSLSETIVDQNSVRRVYNAAGEITETSELPAYPKSSDYTTYIYEFEANYFLSLAFAVKPFSDDDTTYVTAHYNDESICGYIKDLNELHEMILKTGFKMSLIRDIRMEGIIEDLEV